MLQVIPMKWWWILSLGLFAAGFLALNQAAKAEPELPKTIRVFPLEQTPGDFPSWLGDNFQQAFASTIQRSPGWRLAVPAIPVREAALPWGLGRKASTADWQYAVLGTCTWQGKDIVLSYWIVDARTGQLLARMRGKGAVRELLVIKSSILAQLRQSLQIISGEQSAANKALAYPEIILEDRGDYEGSSLQWALDNPASFQQRLRWYDTPRVRGGNDWYSPPAITGIPVLLWPTVTAVPYHQ